MFLHADIRRPFQRSADPVWQWLLQILLHTALNVSVGDLSFLWSLQWCLEYGSQSGQGNLKHFIITWWNISYYYRKKQMHSYQIWVHNIIFHSQNTFILMDCKIIPSFTLSATLIALNLAECELIALKLHTSKRLTMISHKQLKQIPVIHAKL